MNANRPVSPAAHGLIELITGLALVVTPFVIELGPAGMALSLGAGILLVGLAIGAEDGLPGSTHEAFDQALVVGMAGGAVALAVAGDDTAALVLAAATLAEFALTVSTRYCRPALRRR